MLRGESRCWARNTPPGTFAMFHKHTAKQDRVPRAGWVLGHGWGCSAAVLQIWRDRCRTVYGFLGTHSPKGLALLKCFCYKSPIHGGLCPVATPGGVEIKLCHFIYGLFVGFFL